MAVNYKIGADASSFKQGVNEAQASLKTLDAALKVNEASFRAGGDAQVYMEQKTQLLTDKMNRQKQLVTQLQQGLQQMRAQGVAPTSVEYQKLEQRMLNAQTAMLETKSSIDGLDQSQQAATQSAGTLADSVNSIGKKISLDQVIGGINTITSTMEKAAGAAVDLGQKIWDNVMNAARWADDTSTMALMYGIDLDTFLRMQKLVSNGLDTSVDAMLKSRDKLAKNIGNGSDGFFQTMQELGLLSETIGKFGETARVFATDDPTEMFWKAGQAIMAMGESFDKEAAAQQLFGKSWKELIPLFREYNSQEAYQKALGEVNVNTEEEVNNLATLNDKVAELQGNIETLTNKGWAALAPSLTAAADALNGLMTSVLDYLDTPEGKAALEQLGTSVSTLFEDLGKIDPEDVVENFVAVFDRLKQGFEWIADHKNDVITALEGIAIGFGALKISEGVLTALKIIAGLKGLTIGGDVAASAASGGSGIWLGRITEAVTNKISGNIGMVSGLMNGAAFGDWFINGTEIGQRLRNGEGMAGAIDTIQTYLTETLPKNWNDFWETSYWGEIGQMYVNGIKKWTEDHSASNSSILGEPGQLIDEWNRLFGESGKEVEIPTEPVVPENAAEAISKVIGPVTVPVVPVVRNGAGYGGSTGGGTMSFLRDIGNGSVNIRGYANGIWSVPFDGYPAILHAGERVVPAREVSSRSYNSNLYVEKMIMNSGADAQGLADAMASANRRRMSGYGS